MDANAVKKPRRWNLHFIRNFMLTFGLVSSIFDYLTFAVVILLLHASPQEFRTGRFVESVHVSYTHLDVYKRQTGL